MTFAILILVNQIPEINSASFSDELPPLPDLPVCSLTNDRFPLPTSTPYSGELFSPPLVVKTWTLCDVCGAAWSHLQSCLRASNVFLPSFPQLFTSQLQLLMEWAACSLSQPSGISLGSLSQHQEELSPFLSPNLHEQKGQFSVINTACVMKDFPNWEKQLIKPSFSENGRDRRPGICLSLIVQALTFSLFPGLDWDCPQLFANFREE